MDVPQCDPKLEYLALKGEIDDAIQQVLQSGHYILGPNVAAFEAEAADYLGCKYAVGVNSGTDALHLALRALGVGTGDEVITTPFTFVATTEAIGMAGAKPVFADIDPGTFNIDPARIEDAISPNTRAILPVHLYGQPAAMDAIRDIAKRHSLHVVEDCAQAMGAACFGKKVGTLGSVGCFSFFPSKNLGCFGDGGLVVTDDQETYERLEMLRRHGGAVKYYHSELGLNSRLDEVQAAVLRIKLRHLDTRNRLRRQKAIEYNLRLAAQSELICPIEPFRNCLLEDTDLGSYSTYNQYTIQVSDRHQVMEGLRAAGVGCAIYYPVPLHMQDVHSSLGYREGDFPSAETVAQRCLSLPMYPELGDAALTEVVRVLEGLVDPNRVAA